LDQDAVDPFVGVEPADQVEDRREIGIARQAVLEGRDPGLRAGARLAAHIDLAGRVVADQYGSEPRSDLVILAQARRRFGNAQAQLGRQGPAVDDARPGYLPRRSPRPGYFV